MSTLADKSDDLSKTPSDTVDEKSLLKIPRFVFGFLLLILVIPSGIFIYMSYQELGKELSVIAENGTSLATLQTTLKSTQFVKEHANDLPDLSRYLIQAQIVLESDVMTLRQERAAASLATRTWMRFMSLIFGAIIIVIGAAFALGRVTGPLTRGSVKLKDIGISFLSSSPGLILAILGAILIAIPNVTQQVIETNDQSTYLAPATISPMVAGPNQQSQAYLDARAKALSGLLKSVK